VAADPTTPPTAEEAEAFERALAELLPRELAKPIPERYVDGRLVAWAPQAGSQDEFMACPLFEVLYHGTRGPGKTDALLMDFAQHVGKGHGAAWRGILFRETYPQLADVVAKSERWFRQVFPGAKFNRQRMAWEFKTGEVLFFRHMRSPDDYWNYHGHEYPWIGWEELTNWANDLCYRSMFSCCRSSSPNVPRKIRATTNPYGVGHNWVKARWRLHGERWKTLVILDSVDPETGEKDPPRAAIHGHLRENRILLSADPNYERTVMAAATSKAQAAAWKDGRWDVVAGGMFDDVWSMSANVLPRFFVPSSWTVRRAFDWGSARPFSVGWWAVSDGSDLRLPDGSVRSTVRSDLIRVAEWYGWTGRPNEGTRSLASEITKGIVRRELAWGWRKPNEPGCRVQPGPADSSIFTIENGRSIAHDMAAPVLIEGVQFPGITWIPSDKRPGSRVAGWLEMRQMIRDARPERKGIPRERPGLFVCSDVCDQFLRTVLGLPRDTLNPDDVDTEAEDHVADETRYMVRSLGVVATSGRTTGMT